MQGNRCVPVSPRGKVSNYKERLHIMHSNAVAIVNTCVTSSCNRERPMARLAHFHMYMFGNIT